MKIKAQHVKLHISQYRLASLANISRFRLSPHEQGETDLRPKSGKPTLTTEVTFGNFRNQNIAGPAACRRF
jgi:hypothetical protein